MKKHSLAFCSRILAAPVTNWAVAAEPSAADLQSGAARNMIAQDDIRKETDRIKGAILALLEDYAQSQLNTDEMTQAKAALDKLSNLSENDMQAVVAMLRGASSTTDAGSAPKTLTSASKEQKEI